MQKRRMARAGGGLRDEWIESNSMGAKGEKKQAVDSKYEYKIVV
mgnify:CR=1 FL=1